jgi:hypothetical protein
MHHAGSMPQLPWRDRKPVGPFVISPAGLPAVNIHASAAGDRHSDSTDLVDYFTPMVCTMSYPHSSSATATAKV